MRQIFCAYIYIYRVVDLTCAAAECLKRSLSRPASAKKGSRLFCFFLCRARASESEGMLKERWVLAFPARCYILSRRNLNKTNFFIFLNKKNQSSSRRSLICAHRKSADVAYIYTHASLGCTWWVSFRRKLLRATMRERHAWDDRTYVYTYTSRCAYYMHMVRLQKFSAHSFEEKAVAVAVVVYRDRDGDRETWNVFLSPQVYYRGNPPRLSLTLEDIFQEMETALCWLPALSSKYSYSRAVDPWK